MSAAVYLSPASTVTAEEACFNKVAIVTGGSGYWASGCRASLRRCLRRIHLPERRGRARELVASIKTAGTPTVLPRIWATTDGEFFPWPKSSLDDILVNNAAELLVKVAETTVTEWERDVGQRPPFFIKEHSGP